MNLVPFMVFVDVTLFQCFLIIIGVWLFMNIHNFQKFSISDSQFTLATQNTLELQTVLVLHSLFISLLRTTIGPSLIWIRVIKFKFLSIQ